MNDARHRTPIPAPPHPDASIFTLNEAAGYMRTRRRTVDELRRRDTAFAQLVFLVGGQPRIRRAALDQWLTKRPAGWSPMGGQRAGAFGRSVA